MKLTDLLPAAGRPVAYYPGLRALAGSWNATILLCQLIYWHGKQSDPEGWIYKRTTVSEEDPDGVNDPLSQSLASETGLTYKELWDARRLLREKGLLHERYDRPRHRTYFQLDLEEIDRAWQRLNPGRIPEGEFPSSPPGIPELPPGNSTDAPRGIPELPQGNPLNGTYIDYAQSTPETTAERPAAASSESSLNLSREETEEPMPSTPVEAMQHPDIKLFQRVCGRVPGAANYQTVIETMRHFVKQKGEATVEYLRPFWLAWSSRRRRSDGRPYDPGSLTWLTEWALNGSIPDEYGGANDRRQGSSSQANQGGNHGEPLGAEDMARASRISIRGRPARGSDVPVLSRDRLPAPGPPGGTS